MGRSILRGLGTYFEECGSIRERIAGLEGQDAREPRNILKSFSTGGTMLGGGVGDLEDLGVDDVLEPIVDDAVDDAGEGEVEC